MGVKVIFKDVYEQITCGIAVRAIHQGNCLVIDVLNGYQGVVYKFSGTYDLIDRIVEDFYNNDKVDLREFELRAL